VEHPKRLAEIAKNAGVKRFVQVSSFSIFGKCEVIDGNSPILPFSIYGKSKAAAEAALKELATPDFSIINVRLPFMFGTQNPSLMGKLTSLLQKVPFFPISVDAAERSMLTYADAADVLYLAAKEERSCEINVADPNLFTTELLAELMRDKNMNPAKLLRIPKFATRFIRKVVPSIGDRLFAKSILASENNWASNLTLKVGIKAEINSILSNVK
jgi:nucleoside-diphosphate-sugar epimerase